MFAVVSYKGNQYKVEPEKEYSIALADLEAESKFTFDEVLLVDDGKKIEVGTPFVKGAKVEAVVVGLLHDKKVTGIKFKAKKRYKRNLGHRQDYTVVKISSINYEK
jgi:large subunit ribosomal protein L21